LQVSIYIQVIDLCKAQARHSEINQLKSRHSKISQQIFNSKSISHV